MARVGGEIDFNHLPPGAVKTEHTYKKGDKLPDGRTADQDTKLTEVTIKDKDGKGEKKLVRLDVEGGKNAGPISVKSGPGERITVGGGPGGPERTIVVPGPGPGGKDKYGEVRITKGGPGD